MKSSIVPALELRRLATAFRDAVERSDRRLLDVAFRDFPNGSCGDAALLLATFLRARGFDPIVVAGWRDRASHAWVLVDDVIVDITADQYDGHDRVTITDASDEWYAGFTNIEHRTRRLEDYDEMTQASLGQIYRAIIANLRLP